MHGQAAGGLEHHPPADLDGVVGEPFVEPAEQCDVDCGADAAAPFAVDQHREQIPVPAVDGVVLLLQLRRLLGVG